MDKKKGIILVAVLILIILAGGWYLSQNKGGGNKKVEATVINETPAQTQTQQTLPADTKASISDLLTRGANLKCTYSSQTADSGSAQTNVYISGKKIRADSSGTSADGTTFSSNMIMDGDYIYVWQPNEKNGLKMPVAKSAEDQQAWKGEASYLNPEQKADYKCTDWSVDDSMFKLPANVTFTDYSETLKSQCAVCDNMTGDQQTTCKKALGCN